MTQIRDEKERMRENEKTNCDNNCDSTTSKENVNYYLKEILAYCEKYFDHSSIDEVTTLFQINERIYHEAVNITSWYVC